MDLTEILLVAVAVGLAILLFVAIALGWIPKNDGPGAALTALHDFQPVDKQNAMEIVIEQKAGKAWTEQESGDAGRKDGADREKIAERDRKDGPWKGHQTHES